MNPDKLTDDELDALLQASRHARLEVIVAWREDRAQLVRHERLKHYLTRKNTPEEDEAEIAEARNTLFNIRAEAFEEAARAADERAQYWKDTGNGHDERHIFAEVGARESAEAIRNLLKETK